MRPGTVDGRAGLARLLQAPAQALVALDYDGTLAPIMRRPPEAIPIPGALDVLAGLSARIGRLALVTGRSAAELVALAGLTAVPGLIVLGQYGAERWHGRLTAALPAAGLAPVRAALPDLLGSARLEDKGLSLVVHVRGLPDPQAELDRLGPALRELAAAHGLVVHPGRQVLEIRPPGYDKRAALLSLCDPPPSAVLFAGDDVGDLPAFDAVQELRARGVPGVLVASASAEGPVALRERADLVVHGPAGVLRLLAELSAALSSI